MEAARAAMIRDQLHPNGIDNRWVLEVMGRVRREAFLPAKTARHAYEDRALPIGEGQTMSQPLVVAAMTQALEIQPADTLLEVGTGSGYQAAILAQLCSRVVTVERNPVLAERAAATLRGQGIDNVQVVLGDGSRGWPSAAPYRGILVAAATPTLPPDLLAQLEMGGRMVIPLGLHGDGEGQELRLLHKVADGVSNHLLFPVRFVPLVLDGGT